MKALFLLDEPSIFDDASAARARMRARAEAIGTLHVVSPSASTYQGSNLIQEGPLSLHVMRAPRFFTRTSIASRVRGLLVQNSIDIISVHDPFEYAMSAFEAVRATDIRLHIEVHTDFLSPWYLRSGVMRAPQAKVPKQNSARRRFADYILPRAAGISVVSKRIQESLVTHYGNSIPAPTLIYEEVSLEPPPKVTLPAHEFSFVLMTVGHLTPEKRIQDIFVALARLQSIYPSLGLMVVGDGPERKSLERYAQKLGLGTHVLFLGYRPDAIGLLQYANTYIQASAYSSSGCMLIEAALARVPIVTTDVGIVGEVFKGYDELLATPPGDPVNLAVHITGYLEDVPVRQQLIQRAEITARAFLSSAPMGPVAIASDLQKTLERSNRHASI